MKPSCRSVCESRQAVLPSWSYHPVSSNDGGLIQCWNWPKRTMGVSCRNVWNFAQGLKFKADFHSKISVCRHELDNSNPGLIILWRCCCSDELQLGHGKRSHFRFYEKLLIGDRQDSIRATLPECGLTVDQQVTCLVDLATDPNILGRFWAGWEPWMWWKHSRLLHSPVLHREAEAYAEGERQGETDALRQSRLFWPLLKLAICTWIIWAPSFSRFSGPDIIDNE